MLFRSLTGRAVGSAGVPLTVRGREFERSRLRLDLSLDHALRDDLYLGLNYAGEYAAGARDHALAARMSLKF